MPVLSLIRVSTHIDKRSHKICRHAPTGNGVSRAINPAQEQVRGPILYKYAKARRLSTGCMHGMHGLRPGSPVLVQY